MKISFETIHEYRKKFKNIWRYSNKGRKFTDIHCIEPWTHSLVLLLITTPFFILTNVTIKDPFTWVSLANLSAIAMNGDDDRHYKPSRAALPNKLSRFRTSYQTSRPCDWPRSDLRPCLSMYPITKSYSECLHQFRSRCREMIIVLTPADNPSQQIRHTSHMLTAFMPSRLCLQLQYKPG